MAVEIKTVDNLLDEACKTFHSAFSLQPHIACVAPGRVNLIGEHTDYNDGFVLPMALPLVTVITGRKSDDHQKCRILSSNMKENSIFKFDLPSNLKDLKSLKDISWVNYIKGILANFHGPIIGFDAVILSSVPLGGGLSSSAALEVATYTFLEALTGSKAKSHTDKALACQKAEHEFAGVPCGIMDQFISIMGVNGNALLIDCRSLQATLIPLETDDCTFVIINSNVKHELSGSEYSSRRNDCHRAAEIMKKKSLREATIEHLESFKNEISDIMKKRAKHVISENERTVRATEAMKAKDYFTFGKLMTESHKSLRDDFEVSCSELDELVEIALAVPGVFGSRMTGGGFGGCTVTLVKKDSVNALISHVQKEYSGKSTVYVCHPSDGAKIIMNNSE